MDDAIYEEFWILMNRSPEHPTLVTFNEDGYLRAMKSRMALQYVQIQPHPNPPTFWGISMNLARGQKEDIRLHYKGQML